MKDKEAFIDFKSTSAHIADSRAAGTEILGTKKQDGIK